MLRQVVVAAAALMALAAPALAKPFLVLDIDSAAGGGQVKIELLPEIAPLHVERIVTLTNQGAYDDVAFHRVLSQFMAQTGDVQYGKRDSFSAPRAGTGSSDLPDLQAEFNDTPFIPGVVGMARSNDPDSANSQFFIMTYSAPYLDGQYTAFGRVVEGMNVVKSIKRGSRQMNGSVLEPDFISKATIVDE